MVQAAILLPSPSLQGEKSALVAVLDLTDFCSPLSSVCTFTVNLYLLINFMIIIIILLSQLWETEAWEA